MMRIRRLSIVLALLFLLAGTIASPVRAFDGRGGEKVVIASDQVIDDDLYVWAGEFVLDGQVNGDVVAVGRMITINGTVNGNLIAAGNTLVLNGNVTGTVRIAGSVMRLGEKARVGRDLVAAGYSLEVQKGSTIGRDVVFAGGQCLLGGEVERNVQVAGGGLEIAGSVRGNVKAEVGEAGQGQAGPPPTLFMPQPSIPVPSVKPGLTLDPSARIAGDLEYTQSRVLNFPSGVIGGKVTRLEPKVEAGHAALPETPTQKIANWALDLLRSLVTLILIGGLLAWLLPIPLRDVSQRLRARPWASLGWGLVTYAAFFFALLLVLFVMVLAAIVFGFLTLKGLSQVALGVGILLMFALILGLVLVTSFVAKIVFGATLGRWMLERFRSPLSEHRYWPTIVGVVVTILAVGLLSFPLLPGMLGWLASVAVILFGLGAIWQWGREAIEKRSSAS